MKLQFILLNLALRGSSASSSLPVIDLGYELHQASYYNETGGFYNFSNIRYAAPPTENLRFRPPQLPATNRSVVQTGAQGRVCPQTSPGWLSTAMALITNYTQGLPFNASLYALNPSPPLTRQPDPRTSEDCLFLDVVVPREVFDRRSTGAGSPVLVWLHGGGFTTGSKDQFGAPAGLLHRAKTAESEGDVIFVALNYRLGALGWSAGATLMSDGAANAGLLDQRFALEWVREHISKFGGDPSRVTLMGESAGAGSILHHITAYGDAAPFHRAILQSPAFFPYLSEARQEQHFQGFLDLLNVSTLADARELPSKALIEANVRQVADAPYGQFIYNPTVDGSNVRDHPAALLSQGDFSHGIEVMVSHNDEEGLLFANPAVTDSASFDTFLRNLSLFQNHHDALFEHARSVIYPPKFDGSLPYEDHFGRAKLLMSDTRITCNTFYLNSAFRNQTYTYIFAVPPALHGDDLKYTFYNGVYGPTFNITIAETLQDYITSFSIGRIPETRVQGVEDFTKLGKDGMALVLNSTGIKKMADPTVNERCRWWQKTLEDLVNFD